jgi:GTP-dependent phosphoenolpyruvate carboxykinase
MQKHRVVQLQMHEARHAQHEAMASAHLTRYDHFLNQLTQFDGVDLVDDPDEEEDFLGNLLLIVKQECTLAAQRREELFVLASEVEEAIAHSEKAWKASSDGNNDFFLSSQTLVSHTVWFYSQTFVIQLKESPTHP